MRIISCAILSGMFFCCTLFGQETSNWELEKEEDDIRISYRWVNASGKKRVREMKAELTINASIPVIVEQFRDPARFKDWQTSIKHCQIKDLQDQQWQTYLLFDLPWPFKGKDLLTKSSLHSFESGAIINSESTPNAAPQKDKVNRIQSMDSKWKMTALHEKKTSLVYTSISYDEPEFPRFIADPVIQNRLITILGLLRENSEDEKDSK